MCQAAVAATGPAARRCHRHRCRAFLPGADFLTPKAIGNRIKAKGLQKLRWYCQVRVRRACQRAVAAAIGAPDAALCL